MGHQDGCRKKYIKNEMFQLDNLSK